MRLLPSEQRAESEKATAKFQDTGKITLCEPCDCNGQSALASSLRTDLRISKEGRRYIITDVLTGMVR